MALAKNAITTVAAVISVLAVSVMLIHQNGFTTQSSSSLRHRSLLISEQPVSSQHQSLYQSNMGKGAQPQTVMMKNQQDVSIHSSGLSQQRQPQGSLWNSNNGSGGSTRTQSSMGQQNPQQNIPQQTLLFRSEIAGTTGQKQAGNIQQAPHDSSRIQNGAMNNVGGGNNHKPLRQPDVGSKETMLQQQNQRQVPPALQEVQNSPQQLIQQQRSSKEVAQLGVSVPDQNPDCEVPNAAEVAVSNPAWVASYPGSGAKLTWKLIRAITGIFTSDDHDHNGRVAKGMVVAIKTHFPSHTPLEIFDKESLRGIGRSILLTRNPIKSIPSYHNFVYEVQNGLLNHSTRAPIEAWIKWRNAVFEQELQAWIDHQKYWIDNYPRDKLHLVSMEHLTSTDRGPATIQHLGKFLAAGGQDVADSMVPYERMPCIWDMFVHGKVPGERERRHSHRSGGPKTYPFTQIQLDQMIAALAQFKNDYGGQHSDLAFILDEYIVTIQEHKGEIEQM